jgi:serine protease
MIRKHRLALLIAPALLVACQEAPTTPTAMRDGPDSLAAFSKRAGPEQVMEGEVIVKVRNGAKVDAVARDHGYARGVAGRGDAFYIMRGQAGNEHAMTAELQKDARVVYAEPNYLRQPTAIDPRLWAFFNPGGLNMFFTKGRSKGLPIPSANASVLDADEDNIEGFAVGGADVVVGSIDTGVDFTHPEFRAVSSPELTGTRTTTTLAMKTDTVRTRRGRWRDRRSVSPACRARLHMCACSSNASAVVAVAR